MQAARLLRIRQTPTMYVCACVCVCTCVRTRARTRAPVRACVRACVCIHQQNTYQNSAQSALGPR